MVDAATTSRTEITYPGIPDEDAVELVASYCGADLAREQLPDLPLDTTSPSVEDTKATIRALLKAWRAEPGHALQLLREDENAEAGH